MNSTEKGFAGEARAGRFLVAKGFSIVAKNLRCRLGELDIVAKKGGIVYLVEVKTVNFSSRILPHENFSLMKRKRMLLTARYFGYEACKTQFLVICIKGGDLEVFSI